MLYPNIPIAWQLPSFYQTLLMLPSDNDVYINQVVYVKEPYTAPTEPPTESPTEAPTEPPTEPPKEPANCCLMQTVCVSEDYQVCANDEYIGVNSTGPVTLRLPDSVLDGKCVTIKLEMQAPIGNRKVRVEASSLIDGAASRVLQNPYEKLHVLYRAGMWHIL